ncbi:C1 family peptidase [uncultured Methanobrevibacter sp.]|uniref:C1 family peptidase n=1 Tax=uncultured Methanobrevibacter sp. TaxID=253161 RepID=UPI00262E82FA|nr:C1 family peptidase [uncultured Methanobrevibacter sp.]
MNVLKITIVTLALIMSVGAVCAAENISDEIICNDSQEILGTTQNDIYSVGKSSFTDLSYEIESADTSFDLNQDYAFNNETDNKNGIVISKDNFIVNGNGRTIDGNNHAKIFNITANNVTLSNIILKNGNAEKGGAISSSGNLTLNNITFIDNYATKYGGALEIYGNATLNINNSRFINNYADSGSAIYLINGTLNIYNTEFTSNVYFKRGQILIKNAEGYVENTTFANIVSSYAPAIYLETAKAITAINSKFINLTANISSGAIGVKEGGVVYIKNCEFINTTSAKNAGAILADIAGGSMKIPGNVTILDTVFKDTSSEFGGAYIQFGGKLLINNTNFINNHATYNGGSIYISFVDNAKIDNCNFTSNGVDLIEGYPTYGGAIVIDMSTANITHSRFINNTASAGNAIYAYDANYSIINSWFENNTNPIYTFFDNFSELKNNTYINDDDVSTNNTYYATFQVGEGLPLKLVNNTIDVTHIPSRFDLRDWGWVSPVQDQGRMGACWTFGMTGALESALLKATGLKANLSENNMQNTMIRYSIYGAITAAEGGGNILSIGYLLSWFGAFIQDADTYDELGKISPIITTYQDIHVQDVMFTPNNEIPNSTQLKLAIMKYGSIDISYMGQSTYNEVTPYYYPENYAQYVNETLNPNHGVSIVGWDDKFPKEKFGITPPDDGAWIVKNSWGTDYGEKGFLYVSYYDKTLLKSMDISTHATSIILENTVPYNKNYQYDIFWEGEFKPSNGTASYMNIFESLDDDFIAAVGTYFNQSGVNYTVEIFVNDVLKLTQEGVSPYLGYHTIKLNDYIPIKKGDIFKAVITSNCVPFINLNETRVHYTENLSFVSFDGQPWEDAYNLGYIACLKAYTVENNTNIKQIDSKFTNITVDYSNISAVLTDIDGYAIANTSVIYKINGVEFNTTTNDDGVFCILLDSNGLVDISYLGDDLTAPVNMSITINNIIPIRSATVVEGNNFTQYAIEYYSGERGGNFTVQLKDASGKVLANKTVLIGYNGKCLERTTDENGFANVQINLVAANRLTFAVAFLGDENYNATMSVYLITINKKPVTMTANAKTYKASAKTKSFTVSLSTIPGASADGKTYFAAGKKVTMKVKGVIYTAKTNDKGQATFKLSLNKKGTYTADIDYAGDNTYKSASKSVKITVN